MRLLFSLCCILLSSTVVSQLSIINVNLNEYNVSQASLAQVTVNNTSGQGIIRIESTITNSAGETLLKYRSRPITIKSGVNILGSHNVTAEGITYTSSPQSNYIKTLHRLPSGAFNYCVSIQPIANLEEGTEYCQAIDASSNEQLYLVNPIDEEVIATTTPLLLWMHTEAFNLLSPGEFFRLTLVELEKDQSASDGVVSNTPIFIKNYITSHQVQYPFDARKLEYGKRYGWIVQKISNGNIIASTESWEFKLNEQTKPKDHMYVDLKKQLDGTIYKVQNDRIFFKYNERYQSTELTCSILSDSREKIEAKTTNEQDEQTGVKMLGYNTFELDLNPYNLQNGFYTLEVLDEKGQKYLLKFYME